MREDKWGEGEWRCYDLLILSKKVTGGWGGFLPPFGGFWFLPGDGATALNLGAHGGGEFAEFLGLLFGEVGGFEGVVFEVEEFPGSVGSIFEKLPGSAAEGPRGVAHVALVSFAAGEEVVALEGRLSAGFQEREDGAAFDSIGDGAIGCFDGGGEEVHGEEGEIAAGAGLDDSRPGGRGGDFESAFIHVLFSAAKISAVGTDIDLSAVIGDEDCEGVLPLSGFFQGCDDFANVVVHVLDESDELGALFGNSFFAFDHFFEPIKRRLDRGVGRIVGEIEEEGVFLVLSFGKVALGPPGENIGGMALGIHLFLVEAHVVLIVTAVVVVVVHHVAEETVEVIEAARVGMRFVIQSEVPFADGGGVVAEGLERLGQHGGGRGEVAPVVFRFGSDDAGNTDEFLVASCEKRSAGRGADRAVGEAFREAHALADEGVDVRTLEVGGSVGGEVAVA